MKPKLLYAIPLVGSIEWLKENGPLNRYLKEFEYLQNNFDVFIISKDKKKFNLLNKTKHEALPNLPLNFRNILFLFFPFIKPKYFIESDVYYADHVSSAFPLIIAKFLFNKKVIVRFNWDWSYFVKREYNFFTYAFVSFLERVSIKNADVVIATTPYLKEVVIKRYNFKKKIVVIPNWIDTDLFKPIKTKRKKNSIISIGRLVSQKDYTLLLKSIKHINNGYSVTLIGDGPEKKDLLSLAKKYNINLNIINKVDNRQIPEYLNSHELFISTSRYEGNPKAVLEAMSCAMPIVATNVIGNSDIIINEDNGLITDRDVRKLGLKITEIFKDDKLKNKISKNAREYVINNCSFDEVFKKITNELLMQVKNG